MLDSKLRRYIDPPLNAFGRRLCRFGLSANQVTLIGLAFGILSAGFIVFGHFAAALLTLILSRLADGLDGAVARASSGSDFGGYLDIVCDFLFYGLIPCAFVFYDPHTNALAGAALLTSFYFNGASFLGYAILAEKHDMQTSAQGIKSLYYSNGLLEGTETIAFFVAICLFPAAFPVLSWGFAGLCFMTATLRIYGAYRLFLTSQASSYP